MKGVAMRKLILMFMVSMLLVCSVGEADQFNIDMSAWGSERKSMTYAMVSLAITDNGFTYDSLSINKNSGDIIVENPSGDVSPFITKANIESVYDVWRADMDIKVAIALAEEEAKEIERGSNAITSLKLADIDAWLDSQIDGITNLEDAKGFLRIFTKRVVRYLKAHEN